MKEKKQNDLLKIIAMLTMLIDHVGVVWLPHDQFLRIIGRIAFPIFAYGIAMGIQYTSDRKKYLLRLFLLGIISQIPYMWLNQGAEFVLYRINQVPQLLYAALVLIILDTGLKKESRFIKVWAVSLTLLLSFLPDIITYYNRPWSFAYGSYGILLSLIFYLFARGSFLLLPLAWLGLTLYHHWQAVIYWMHSPEQSILYALLDPHNFTNVKNYGMFTQDYSFLAFPIIFVIEQLNLEWKIPKWITYWFYPLHIALIVIAYKLTH